jgi:hypothetical protein
MMYVYIICMYNCTIAIFKAIYVLMYYISEQVVIRSDCMSEF